MNSPAQDPSPASGHSLPPGRAFVILIGIILLLAGYIGLAYFLKVAAIFAGSFLLFFWVGVEKAAPTAIVGTVFGALGGIVNGSLLHAGVAAALGIDVGLMALAGLVLLALALYMLLIGKLPALFNQSYMLFVTVAAIPQLSDVQIFVSMVEGVFLSAVYFVGLLWIFRRIGADRLLFGSR